MRPELTSHAFQTCLACILDVSHICQKVLQLICRAFALAQTHLMSILDASHTCSGRILHVFWKRFAHIPGTYITLYLSCTIPLLATTCVRFACDSVLPYHWWVTVKRRIGRYTSFSVLSKILQSASSKRMELKACANTQRYGKSSPSRLSRKKEDTKKE